MNAPQITEDIAVIVGRLESAVELQMERVAELRGECGQLRTENVWLKEQIREALRVSGHRRRGFILRMALERIGEEHR